MQVELKRSNNTLSRVVRGTLTLSLSTDLASSLQARTGLPNDSSLSANTSTVFNASINNASINNFSFINASFSDVSVNNASINNVSFSYAASASSSDISFNNGPRSEVNSISASLPPTSSNHATLFEATTATMAIRTPAFAEVHEDASGELEPQSDTANRPVASSGIMPSNTRAEHDFNANKDDTRSTGTRDRSSPNYVASHQIHEGETTTTDSGGFPAGLEERYTPEGRPLVASPPFMTH